MWLRSASSQCPPGPIALAVVRDIGLPSQSQLPTWTECSGLSGTRQGGAASLWTLHDKNSNCLGAEEICLLVLLKMEVFFGGGGSMQLTAFVTSPEESKRCLTALQFFKKFILLKYS